MLELKNRRRAPRVNQSFSVDFYGDDLNLLQGQTINLSSTGARLICNRGADGNHFHVVLNIDGRPVTALADKVWDSPLNGSSGAVVIGLHFSAMNQRDRRLLSDYCGREAQKQARRTLPTSIPLPRKAV
ncbi:MAG: PilZ domain-containing protein [Vulcanimicrobiota bacterium]